MSNLDMEVVRELARLRRDLDMCREAALNVTSFIQINAKMSGPERVGLKHGAGLKQAVYALDDALASIWNE